MVHGVDEKAQEGNDEESNNTGGLHCGLLFERKGSQIKGRRNEKSVRSDTDVNIQIMKQKIKAGGIWSSATITARLCILSPYLFRCGGELFYELMRYKNDCFQIFDLARLLQLKTQIT
jgi:hypothetical protein